MPVADKLIVVHYYLGACHWWLVEYDPDERRGFGYVCLGDPINAEWGYVSLDELEQLERLRLQHRLARPSLAAHTGRRR